MGWRSGKQTNKQTQLLHVSAVAAMGEALCSVLGRGSEAALSCDKGHMKKVNRCVQSDSNGESAKEDKMHVQSAESLLCLHGGGGGYFPNSYTDFS